MRQMSSFSFKSLTFRSDLTIISEFGEWYIVTYHTFLYAINLISLS